MLSLTIDDALKTAWPETRLGFLLYTCRVTAENAPLWEHLERDVLPPLRATLEATPLADMPNLGAGRRAYKACGKDPGRCRISSEALYRRLRQGKELYHINSVVDANNLLSIATGFSLGSYDADRLEAPLLFRLGRSGESYAGIGKGALDLEHLPLLADAAGPVGSPTSDATRAMITLETRRVLTLIYSFSPRPALEAALDLAARAIPEHARAALEASGIAD